jgi:hypothetical protein
LEIESGEAASADRESIPDADRLADAMDESIDELLARV